jgi:hypothetical protein
MRNIFPFYCFCTLLVWSCTNDKAEIKVAATPLTSEEVHAFKVDSIKQAARAGDLIVRLGDDILSYQIKLLNEKDQSFSHAGVIVENGGQLQVAHIAPDDGGKDVINYIPIDSFVNPVKNLNCALFRYNLNDAERQAATDAIEAYRQKNIHFDWQYDLATDDKMYCSELISKAYTKATQNKLQFKQTLVPKRMQPALANYFKDQASKEEIASRKIMTIDNLYNIPECKKVMQLTLKTFPGQ